MEKMTQNQKIRLILTPEQVVRAEREIVGYADFELGVDRTVHVDEFEITGHVTEYRGMYHLSCHDADVEFTSIMSFYPDSQLHVDAIKLILAIEKYLTRAWRDKRTAGDYQWLPDVMESYLHKADICDRVANRLNQRLAKVNQHLLTYILP